MKALESSAKPPPPAGRLIALRQMALLSGLIFAMLLCGCASRAPWQKETFAFVVPSGDIGSPAHTNILSLKGVTISALYQGQQFVYRTGENSYEQDPYAEFLVPPNRMLEECLRLCLRNGHSFAEVLDPGSSLEQSCSLEVFVSQLYGDFRQPDQPFGVVQMSFLLYSTEPAYRGRVLWQREFFKRLPLGHRTAVALVAGWDTCLQQIMEEVNADLTHLAVPEGLRAKKSEQE